MVCFCSIAIKIGGKFMDSTMELVSFELPKTDLKLFKELAKTWDGLFININLALKNLWRM